MKYLERYIFNMLPDITQLKIDQIDGNLDGNENQVIMYYDFRNIQNEPFPKYITEC